MTRESLTKLAALVAVVMLVAMMPVTAAPVDACGADGGMIGANPVVNGAMTFGSLREPTSEGLSGGAVQELAGTANVSEAYGFFGAAAWTISVANGSRFPHSDAGWSDSHGTANSGALWLHYDVRDTGDEAIAVRQHIGDEVVGGVFCDSDEVALDVVSDGPVDLVVAVHTAENPGAPALSDVVRIGRDGGHGHMAMPTGAPFQAPWSQSLVLDVDAAGTLTMIEILIDDVGDGSSDGSWVFVDNVAIFGSSIVPLAV